MQAINQSIPPFVSTYRATIGIHPADQGVALILFIISGGIWGLIFTWMVKNPTIIKRPLQNKIQIFRGVNSTNFGWF